MTQFRSEFTIHVYTDNPDARAAIRALAERTNLDRDFAGHLHRMEVWVTEHGYDNGRSDVPEDLVYMGIWDPDE